mgnify:CR=1 FL=1
MQYYIFKTVAGDFPAIVQRVISSLKTEGFGVLTEIDVKATIKQKRNIDFRDYRILGACNHPLAHQALTADDKIGTMGTSEQRGLAIVRGIGASFPQRNSSPRQWRVGPFGPRRRHADASLSTTPQLI